MDDTSKQEILDAINTSATETQQQLDALKTEVAQIKATMVTKDYLSRSCRSKILYEA